MKRLARMALGLAARTMDRAGKTNPASDVYFGTAWGALSETHDFLEKLYASNEFYTSPIDFVGSVHNAPAGQVAMRAKARGANVAMTGGDTSFEQALMAAHYLAAGGRQPVLVGGADEMHPVFSALFDPSVPMGDTPADGGGMLLLETAGDASPLSLCPGYFAPGEDVSASLQAVLASHGGARAFNARIGAVMVGIPAAHRENCTRPLNEFKRRLGLKGPWIDYRRHFGEFASASAVAAVAAMALLERGTIPGALAGGADWPLAGRAILLLGLGATTTTMLATKS